MSIQAREPRPLCAEVAAAAAESLVATASRVEHWLLVEYGGYWPYDPLDASIFAGRLRGHLEAQLEALPHSRLLLVKQPGRVAPARVRVFYGWTRERGSRFYQLELDAHADLLELDLAATATGAATAAGTLLEHPLLLVCTHGKRDRCCARYGQPLCEALHATTSRGWIWQASHVGGDRFAGNVVCLPEGIYFGRVARDDVDALVDGYRQGRIDLARYRGRSCYAFPVQAAEAHVRAERELRGFYDLRLLELRRDGADAWTVRLAAEVAGDVDEVRVERRYGDETYLTCRAELARRPRHYVAVGAR